MSDRAKAPIVRLTPDLNKIVESILFILSAARKQGKNVTQYDIVKTLFLADRRHLNEYGRPITFDNYYAMQHGPVPTTAYNLLKGDKFAVDQIGGKVPWVGTPMPKGKALAYSPLQDHDEEQLAPSEIEILSESLITVKSLNFDQIKRLTHEDAAYLDAWEGGPTGNGSYPMSLGMLFDEPNMDVAADLEFVSKLGAN